MSRTLVHKYLRGGQCITEVSCCWPEVDIILSQRWERTQDGEKFTSIELKAEDIPEVIGMLAEAYGEWQKIDAQYREHCSNERYREGWDALKRLYWAIQNAETYDGFDFSEYSREVREAFEQSGRILCGGGIEAAVTLREEAR